MSKNKRHYQEFVQDLDELARGGQPNDLERHLIKTQGFFLSGHPVDLECLPASDTSRDVLFTLRDYAAFVSSKKQVAVDDAVRDFVMEQDVYPALLGSSRFALNFLAPFLPERTHFGNALFNDIRELGFAYVDAITSGLAQEYLPSEESYPLKVGACNLAKSALRASEAYKRGGLDSETCRELNKLLNNLVPANVHQNLLRPHVAVSVKRKNVYKKQEMVQHITEDLTTDLHLGFVPEFLLPIANGGVEPAIYLSNNLDDLGHKDHTVYPILYSRKTNHHRAPWTENDQPVLSREYLADKRLLLVEDWVTSGKTLIDVMKELDVFGPKEMRVATLKRDPMSLADTYLSNFRFYTGAVTRYAGTKTDVDPYADIRQVRDTSGFNS